MFSNRIRPIFEVRIRPVLETGSGSNPLRKLDPEQGTTPGSNGIRNPEIKYCLSQKEWLLKQSTYTSSVKLSINYFGIKQYL